MAAILGWPSSQSLSPVLHDFWFKEYAVDGTYIPINVRPEEFASCVHSLMESGFVGANVTVPHKESAFALCQSHDRDALDSGAVNTLVFADDKICGLNTDVQGFSASLMSFMDVESLRRAPAVLLGAGGAARAVAVALTRLGAPEIRLLNRTRARALSLTKTLKAPLHVLPWEGRESALSGAGLLVNATSLGMQGKEELKISLEKLPDEAVVADIVYNPLWTNLLDSARMRGLRTLDGLGMLMHQARPAFAAWFGIEPKVTPALREALEMALRA